MMFQNNFNCLDKTTNIFGNHLLEASAGTGKTFAIEQIVVRLLLEREEPLTIEQILVVTFTRAATRELKLRIRTNLEKTLQQLKRAKSNRANVRKNCYGYLLPFIENDKVIDKSIDRIEEALLFYDQAQIFTIHGFCFRMLQEFAFYAKVKLSIEESDNTELIKESIIEHLKYLLDQNKYSPYQISFMISKHRNMDLFIQKVIKSIEDESLQKEELNVAKIHQDFLEKLEKIEEEFSIEKLHEDFEKIFPTFKKNYKGDLFEEADLVFETISQKKCNFYEFDHFIKSAKILFEFFDEKNKKVRAKKLSEKDLHYPSFIEIFRKEFYPIIEKLLDHKLIFNNVVLDISKRIKEILEEKEIFTFDKILNKMKEALTLPLFEAKVKEKYEAALVDEFQDTDPLQWKIFEKLFLSDKKMKAFYLIGDPKQSIYSFRKADLYTYLKAVNKIGASSHLDTNYRSSKSLVSSLNHLFSEKFASTWLKLPKLNKNLSYFSVNAGIQEDSLINDNKSPIHFFICEGMSKGKSWPSVAIEEKLFSYISNQVIELQEKHKIGLDKFSVLVRDRYQADRLNKFLAKANIKSITKRTASLKDSLALTALKDIFKAVIFSNNLNYIKIALSGLFINWNVYEIKKINEESDSNKVINRFHYLKNILQTKGLSAFFREFLKSSFTKDKMSILEKLTQEKDLLLYQDTHQLIELFLEEENSKKMSFENILNFFEKIDLFDQENERLKKTIYLDEPAIQITTIHMSKGLEYNIVFVLGLVSRTAQSEEENIEEINAEKMRQFYVAMTRSKWRVYAPLIIDNAQKVMVDNASAMELFCANVLRQEKIEKTSILNRLDEASKDISYEIIDDIEIKKNDREKSEEIDLLKPKQIKFNDSTSYIYSFSSMQKEKKEDYEIIQNENILPMGSETGIIFHTIFEKILKGKSFAKNKINKIIQDEITGTQLEEFSIDVLSIINRTLSIKLNDKFSLKDISFNNMLIESEFLFSFSNKENFMKGFIDLIFSYDNKYYLVDWKTNYLGKNSEDYNHMNIEKAMNEHNYFVQAAIYAESLFRYLKVIDKRPIEESFGGAFYIFLRGLSEDNGNGIYRFQPDLKILENIKMKEAILCMK